MGTSRFSETRGSWTLGVSLFSGRPDPVWKLPAPAVRQLEAMWAAMEPLAASRPEPPPLGYRGCFATDPRDRHWSAYGGAVTLLGPGGSEVRRDPSRAFERFILQSAPLGALSRDVEDLIESSANES
jgi:hypothetical protein